MVLTDFGSWQGLNGNTNVPVVAFAAFYVTGWFQQNSTGGDNADMATNEPYPDPGNGGPGCGDIWGHFVKYVDTLGQPGTTLCSPTSPTPCVPSLTK
jgi:hypothetical protein